MSDSSKIPQPKPLPEGAYFGITENNLLHIMTMDIEDQRKMRKVLNSPVLRTSSTGANYRFINYLDGVGLLKDTDDERGTGWRKISILKHIYILILIELRSYGLKTEALEKFAALFLDGEKNSVAFTSVMLVLGGIEMTIIIQKDGTAALLDPVYVGFYESEEGCGLVPRRTYGEVQLKLSAFVNEALSNIGKKPVKIKNWFGKYQDVEMLKGSLSPAEIAAILEMRSLDHTDTLKIRQMKNQQTMIDVERVVPREDEVAKQLASAMDEFGELIIATEGGKVVSFKKSKKTIVKN